MSDPKPANPTVLLKTNKGDITLRLFADKAPVTVANFLRYVDEGFFNGTIFHRVIDGFMIQGGGFTRDMKQKATHNTIRNEAQNGLKNSRGTIAMARTNVVDSATAQFFINVADNAFLDFKSADSQGFGYCVFGEVTSGMETVDAIRKVKTGTKSGFQDVPVEAVEITEAQRTDTL
jgi:cyclophilin family peptidyl-prolyl cis-trans isomerase